MDQRYRLQGILLLAGALCLGACSKEEAPAVTDEPPPVEETAPDVDAEATTDLSEPDDAVTDEETSLEVVEESSAADVESSDESIMLAMTDDTPPARNWKYREGKHYTRLVPTQQTVGGADKIEVAEAFMYLCGGCYALEPSINAWAEAKDPNVRFVRIPVMFNNLARTHAQLYYTEHYLAQAGKLADPAAFRQKVFDEYHLRGNRLASEAAIQRLFASEGVSAEDFQRTWGSFEVNQSMRVAEDLSRRYGVSSVPAIIVNGKYKTDPNMTGGYDDLFALVDELTVREGLR